MVLSIFLYFYRYNKNPTARTFRCCFGHICSFSLMKCSTTCSNCEPDTDEFINVDVLKDIEVDIPIEIVKPHEDAESDTTDIDSDSTDSSSASQNKSLLETCSEVYFSGYLAKKCLIKFMCTDCQSHLIRPNHELNNEQQLLVMYKTYDHVGPMQGLKAPSEKLLNISKMCFDIFSTKYTNIKTEKNVLGKLKEKALQKINNRYPDLQDSTCYDHYLYIIELLFRTLIFKQCKRENCNIHLKKHAQNVAKLRIFQNK